MKVSRKYPSDLSFEQWEFLSRHLPKPSRWGRKPIDRRRILDAIFYLLRTGCQWRMLPREFPCWSTVYGVFRQWRITGAWQRIHAALVKWVRKRSGKKPTPTTAILDSQSIRTAEGGEERGYDSAKKITGRKRHIAVDTLGMVQAVVVHGAYWQDYDGACFVAQKLRQNCPRLKRIFADSIYRCNQLPQWMKAQHRYDLQIVKRPRSARGHFDPVPKRWIVERTFAWIMRYRRNARDYERLTENGEAIIHATMIQFVVRRFENMQK
ncbi:MAG: IS5 family transposase [Pirellulales bacterium]